MRKIGIFIISLILISVFGYYGWRLNNTKNENAVNQNDGTSTGFQISGNLVRNNPGLEKNRWYLIGEQPGEPVVQLILDISSNSECNIGSKKIECEKLELPSGTRARVEGERIGASLKVRVITTEAFADMIYLEKLSEGNNLESPLKISGKARGPWFFEASFPIKLFLLDGTLVTTSIATAKGEWMTNEFVPFESTLFFEMSTATKAELVLAADNPSGLPENDRQIKIPINLLPSKNLKKINLYYYDENKDKDSEGNILCSKNGLVAFPRTIISNESVLFNTLKILLTEPLSDDLKNKKITSEFPITGFEIDSVNIQNGIATIKFLDKENRTSGGSCRVNILRSQIEAVAKQFSTVKEVLILPETILQP